MKIKFIFFSVLIITISCSENSEEPQVQLKADFESNKRNIIQGEQVTFQDAAAGDPDSWSWVFEGGNPTFSSEQNPVITYSEVGEFDVSLTVYKDSIKETAIREKLIIVSPIQIILKDQQFVLVENPSVNYKVGQIQVSITNSQVPLSYEILSGNTNNTFTLDNEFGILSVKNPREINVALNPTFTLEVQVSWQSVKSTAKVTIDLIEIFKGSDLPETEGCKLEKIFEFDYVDLGFPNNAPSPSLSTVNVNVLFVDFNNAPATRTTDLVFNLIEPINSEFYEEMSYGRMSLKLIPNHGWLRLQNSPSFYAEAIRSGTGHLAFIQEAVDLADESIDFSETDIVVVITNPDVTEIGYGPTFGSLDAGFAIQADGNSILTGITSGYDLNYWGGLWLAHEMGHSLGLPDLYQYGSSIESVVHQYVGFFGIMGIISADAPGFFAYERWLLGWLDDSQIYCHSEGDIAIEINQIATVGGLKAVSIPISNTAALIIESRRRSGFDSSLTKEGVLVYLVDTSIERGRGPIRIISNAGGNFLRNAPMVTGDVYTYQNIRIEVIESRTTSDVVLVSVP